MLGLGAGDCAHSLGFRLGLQLDSLSLRLGGGDLRVRSALAKVICSLGASIGGLSDRRLQSLLFALPLELGDLGLLDHYVLSGRRFR
jgi:hypothetical protein